MHESGGETRADVGTGRRSAVAAESPLPTVLIRSPTVTMRHTRA